MARSIEDLGPLADDPVWVSPRVGTSVWTDNFSDLLSVIRLGWVGVIPHRLLQFGSRRSVEIGSRDGLKIHCGKPRAGSSPASGTQFLSAIVDSRRPRNQPAVDIFWQSDGRWSIK